MIVRRATNEDIHAVCGALRPEDAAALAALGLSHLRLDASLCRKLAQGATILALCADDGAPVSIIALTAYMRGLGNMSKVATARWPEIAIAAVKWWHREFVPQSLSTLRVVTCEVMAVDATGHFLTHLGFAGLQPPLPLGVNGEKFYTFAWINPRCANTP